MTSSAGDIAASLWACPSGGPSPISGDSLAARRAHEDPIIRCRLMGSFSVRSVGLPVTAFKRVPQPWNPVEAAAGLSEGW